ncbi:MgtC/SapB family protein [Nesterenkonia halotolerans]|uniref:Mg2+ transporter-C (MgtC) family protein n=1 Tax=Nesterenkonia halotolerans TaxID=225325 RepID=A0ABR9J3C9_9MICC|nr:MgtC/SapB family protein [Nesterenkonia halotolerans]MBE1513374.1 putative Mg2+ transporter-C (MgtC) family protein [Nesterenkonia halotolerans]
MEIDLFPETFGTQVLLLVSAFVLSAAIGIERDVRQKSAGARTHILVGMGSALFTLVSAYGFSHLLGGDVVLDPSRIAAQIVSGIGFIGAGVVFVRQNMVSGLTTAASIWVTAAVGMACGAGMPMIAALTALLYLLAVTLITTLVRRLPRHDRSERYVVRYADGRGILREILGEASQLGYETRLVRTRRMEVADGFAVDATMTFTRTQRVGREQLFEALHEIEGVLEIRTANVEND